MPLSNTIQAILFDLDNTLIDRDEALRAYLIQTWSPSEDELYHWLKLDEHGYAPREPLCKAVGQARGIESEHIWDNMRARISHFVSARHTLRHALESLNQQMPCGILSNGSGANQRSKLEHAELNNVFAPQCVWISGELGVSKPHPDAFEPALEYFASMNISPHHVAMVGDDVHRDIIPAQRLGMSTVWVHHNNQWPTSDSPDIVLKDVNEIETWIRTCLH